MFRRFHIFVLNRYWFVVLFAVGSVADIGLLLGGCAVAGCAIFAASSQ
jgi:hypothetical protein